MTGKNDIKFIPVSAEREAPNGRRCRSGAKLTDGDIIFLLGQIRAIGADASAFAFNGGSRTRYDAKSGKIHVARDVFPCEIYSPHPRDLLSPRAVLALEYYGRNPDDVCACLNAAVGAPGLRPLDRFTLVNFARHLACERSLELELADGMKDILNGRYEHDPAKTVSARDFIAFRAL